MFLYYNCTHANTFRESCVIIMRVMHKSIFNYVSQIETLKIMNIETILNELILYGKISHTFMPDLCSEYVVD